MDDFAAAAMLRVIALGLRRLGIGLPPQAPRMPRAARIQLADKRRLLAQLHAQHGAVLLLRLGEGIRDARDEPALTALALARDPPELIERWQRLERFVHSRHRVVLEGAGEGWLRLRHVSRVEDEPPGDAEHLLVVGLLVELARRLGTAGLRAHPASAAGWSYEDGAWPEEELPAADLGAWVLRWTACAARADGAPPADAADADWVQAAYRVLAADPSRRWTLAALAGILGLPARSLQRRLQAGATSFSALLLDARLAHSAELLAGSRQPPAQIGYLSGFADQAHFTRAFRQHTAMTPVKYRERFAAGGA